MYTKIDLPEQFNLTTELLDLHVAAGNGDRIAVRTPSEDITYAQLLISVCQFSQAIRDLGIRPEERVALLLHDRPEFLYAFLGAARAGCISVPMNTMLKSHDYEYQLTDSRARAIVIDADLAEPRLLDVIAGLRRMEHVIVVGDSSGLPDEWHSFTDVIRGQPADFPPEQTSRDEPAFWLYSSGSTGPPKAAVHLHRDCIYSAELFGQNVLQITTNDVIYSVPRLFFAYGLGNSLYIPLHLGVSVVLVPDRPTPGIVFGIIEKFRPTILFSVPTGYAQMMAYADQREDAPDLSSIRIAYTAGETLPKGLYDRWYNAYGVPLVEGYGSSELLHITISNQTDTVQAGSCGQIVDGYEARIVDDEDHVVAPGNVGTLEMKGGSIAAYYWCKAEKNCEAFRGWWFRTGDQFYVDDDGYYWFVGRVDDMIKSSGIWVSPAEVEGVLSERSEVLEAGVVGVPDAEGLDKPVGFVALNPQYAPNDDQAEALKKYLKSRLAPYKVPRQIIFLEELPKTATGKIQRFKLRELGREMGAQTKPVR